ncbi:hypothetical protein WKW79_20065 [Variovorax robiniae]|uniref:Aspartate/ornithine carbamoyltransferase carbamoyl-P binding domain-containing protein n=1 Tax=Variovorax robiniae TaxID=1836199 RepID=A0ABU8XDX9_9BURK
MTPVNIGGAAAPTFAAVHSIPILAAVLPSSHRPPGAARILELFAGARRIRADLRTHRQHAPLRGRNLALLIDDQLAEKRALLQRAATEIGARVAQVRYRPQTGTPHADVGLVARTLGRMYDAIDCGTLPAATVHQIEAAAGVPVYEGLGLDSHPLRLLADLMTLHEHPLPPATPLSIRFIGDASSGQGKAFVSAARNIGFEVTAVHAAAPAAADATFVIEAYRQAHWPIRTCAGAIDDNRRTENHCNLIQAVLIDSIGQA